MSRVPAAILESHAIAEAACVGKYRPEIYKWATKRVNEGQRDYYTVILKSATIPPPQDRWDYENYTKTKLVGLYLPGFRVAQQMNWVCNGVWF